VAITQDVPFQASFQAGFSGEAGLVLPSVGQMNVPQLKGNL
jgi:hypothetical protein